MFGIERSIVAAGWRSLLVLSVLVAGCFEARTRPQTGGETHFMRECEGSCAGGLACVCGVCTEPCEEDAPCADLADGAICMQVDADTQACVEQTTSVPSRACAAGCEADADCAELGGGFVCAERQCRETAAASAPPVFVGESGSADAGCSGSACALSEQPLVLLLVDTSGSMERRAGCACVTPECGECLPDCAAGERNRWIEVVEVLGGTLSDYDCESLERTVENGATFDLGYYTPHHAPRGNPQADGVLDVYRDRARFGLATFDGFDTYVGATAETPRTSFDFDKSAAVDGLWSYNPLAEIGGQLIVGEDGARGAFYYPGCEVDYFMDTGIRGPQAEQGALRVASLDDIGDGFDPLAVNQAIQADLLVTRPYGGTPIAAALDDLYFYLALDARTARERATPVAKHVVLISDGEPDADYRDVGCMCATDFDPSDPFPCGGDPSNDRYNPALMHCPYPAAEEAARQLRCGRGAACDGPVDQLHVIAYAVDDPLVLARQDAIAREGGRDLGARLAASPIELRAQLAAVLDDIAVP